MRRRVLASLLVIGVVGAIAGGSTLALFSDTETSSGNVFTAGAVDLQVDWNESYNGVVIERQSLTDNPGPVFNLSDVKPGDEGEATLSLHVFDNPSYIWMRANLTEDDENTANEPELDAGDSPDNASQFDGELAENTNVELWYDDGDNVRQDGEPSVFTGEVCREVPLDVAIVMDRSGSMTNEPGKFQSAKDGAKILYNSLNTGGQGALASFASGATLNQELTDNKTLLNDSVDSLNAGGTTNIEAGIDTASAELINGSNARSGASKVMIVLTDGEQTTGDAVAAADRAKAEGIRIIAVGYGSGPDQSTLEGIATSSDDVYNADTDDIEEVFASISDTICEPGTLENLDAALDNGVPLDANLTDDGLTAYVNSTTRYIGFAWNVPLETGNEVQTDTAMFDIEFYAEQERNNPDPQNPFATN